MTKLNELAKAYVPKKTLNVADLEFIPIDVDVVVCDGTKKDGTPFTYNAIVVDGEEYRVVDSVLKQLKTILANKPNIKNVKVVKEGEGKTGTSYQVIQLD